MKMIKEIKRDYDDFKCELRKKQVKIPGGYAFLECPFCETGMGAVEYENGMMICRICNHWWARKKPQNKTDQILWFAAGFFAGILMMEIIIYLWKYFA